MKGYLKRWEYFFRCPKWEGNEKIKLSLYTPRPRPFDGSVPNFV